MSPSSHNVTMSSEANEMAAGKKTGFPLPPKIVELPASWFLMSTLFVVFRERKYQNKHIWVKKQSTSSKDLWTSSWRSTFSFFKSKNWGFIISYNRRVGREWPDPKHSWIWGTDIIWFLSVCLSALLFSGRLPPSPQGARWPSADPGKEILWNLPNLEVLVQALPSGKKYYKGLKGMRTC